MRNKLIEMMNHFQLTCKEIQELEMTVFDLEEQKELGKFSFLHPQNRRNIDGGT